MPGECFAEWPGGFLVDFGGLVERCLVYSVWFFGQFWWILWSLLAFLWQVLEIFGLFCG